MYHQTGDIISSSKRTLAAVVLSVLIGFSVANAFGTLSDTLKLDTILTAEFNPWNITSALVIPKGVTLTVEAGVEIQFSPSASIQVESDGCLITKGTDDNRITLTCISGSNSSWNGITFDHSMKDNVLSHVDMAWGDGQSQMILVQYSKLLIDHMTWSHTTKTIIEVTHPSLLIRNSVFPDVNERELIHGVYLRDNEYLILDGNVFGRPTGYNDVIDFSDCRRPGPVFEVYNNVFMGGGDDGLDVDGCDSHVEGNLFMNFHKGNTTSSTSNGIATGIFNSYSPSIVAVRNVFLNNDHAVLLKEGSYLRSDNNVYVNCKFGAINYGEWPDRTVEPGKGADLNGDIFWNDSSDFQNQFAQPGKKDPVITVNRCIISKDLHSLGMGNLDVDPKFVDPGNDFHLQPVSPARGKGPNGLDMGRWVPEGASISGEPDTISSQTTIALTIDGPGITDYEYSVNNPAGPWSGVFAIAENPKINLTNLKNGESYTVYVKGKNSAGRWQTNPEYASSRTWMVVTSVGVTQTVQSEHPKSIILHQNTPNPFNPLTVVEFDLPESHFITLILFDGLGREVAKLASGQYPAGKFNSIWDARNFPSGIYYARFQVEDFVQTIKMSLVK